MTKWHGGKGSSPRKIDKDKFDTNWDAIFNKKQSPCVKICKLDEATGKCIGCGRTLNEIAEAGKRNDIS